MEDRKERPASSEAQDSSPARRKPPRRTPSGQMFSNVNFPLTGEGLTMHVGTGKSDVAPRILTVGDLPRARRIAHFLDDPENNHVITSDRNVVTFTNTFRGVPVSIIATGMGFPMMDFIVREATHFLPGPVVIIRLGTCGIIDPNTKVGKAVVATSSRMLQQNYDYDPSNPEDKPYTLTNRVYPHQELTDLLKRKLRSTLTQERLAEGLNITAETFYNSQGRMDDRYSDYNAGLLDFIRQTDPEAVCLEMETYKLLHLAAASKGRIRATACAIGLLQRMTRDVVQIAKAKDLELFCGHAVLNTLTEFPLD